jgi:hypothetical protein
MQINDELRVVVEAEVDKAIQRLKAFDDSLGKAEKGANGLGSALEKQFKEALSAKNAVVQLGAAVSSSLAVYALASKGVQALTGFVKSSVEAFSEYETIQTNLAVVLGSTEKAGAAFEELKAMAAKTPFSVEGLSEAAVQLKQTGTAMRDMKETLTMLGDAAGGNGEKFRRLVANYAQIQSVGKTTAMDLRQFAQAGLPILDVLKKMGVQGVATAEQITEAFRIMTSEGGVFYGGMAAGAQTLAGKTLTLADTWKDFKATFTETTGLGQAWKGMLDELTKTIQEQTDKLTEQKAAREALSALKSGAVRPEDLAALAEYKASLDSRTILTQQEHIIRQTLERQLRGKEKLLDYAREELELAARRNAEEENREAIIVNTEREYGTALAEINAKYAETQAGKIEAIEQEIAKYREYLSIRKQAAFTTPVGEKLISVGLGDEEQNRVAAVIAMLEESLAKMNESLRKSKTNLEDWQKVLKEAMGFSDRDIAAGALDTGVKAVGEYARRVEEAGLRVTSLNGLLGEQSDVLSEAAGKWEKLLQAMVESGKWDGTEASFLMVAENLTRAKKALADDEYLQKIGELQKKLEDLGKSESELAREALKAGGYTDEQADAVKALMDEYDRKGILSSYREEVSRLGKDQAELALETLKALGATAKETAEMETYIKTLRDASLASRGWEEVLAAWVSSGVRDIFPELSRQAADAVGNISASLASISFDAVLTGFSEIGKAMALNADAETAFGNAIAAMGQQLLDALPSLFLQAGLQLIAQGQWALGLGFIAAAGSAALAKGYVQGTIEQKEEEEKEKEKADRNAHGNVFDDALVRAYARGASFTNQVISSPTYFRHGGELGLMGEAGPEAVIPLKRMPNGDLGVESAVSGGPTVTVNIINNSGAQVSKEEQSDQYGNKQIDVIIGNMVNSHLASGRADKALASRYDIKTKGV